MKTPSVNKCPNCGSKKWNMYNIEEGVLEPTEMPVYIIDEWDMPHEHSLEDVLFIDECINCGIVISEPL